MAAMKTRMGTAVVLIILVAFSLLSASLNELSPQEKELLDKISESRAFAHITYLSRLSPRLVGSGTSADRAVGTDYDAAMYIKRELESYGLKAWVEEFSFEAWVLYEYGFIVDFDGDFKTTDDQIDMAERMIPSRHWPDHVGHDVRVDTTAPIVFLKSDSVNDVSGKVVFARRDMESRNGASVFKIMWEEGAIFNVTCSTGFPGIRETRWWKTYAISESDFTLIQSKANSSTRARIIYKTTKRTIKAYNVIGVIEGNDEREVLLVAHYDSVFNEGADDNASGVAALLETARVLSKYDSDRPIHFLFTDGEEEGLYGAYEYVRRHSGTIYDATVLNVDCVGYGDARDLHAGITYSVGGVTYRSSKKSDRVVADAANALTGYRPPQDLCYDECMDSLPFMKAGIETTNIISENIPYLHSSLDNPERIDRALFGTATKTIALSTFRMAGGRGQAESQTLSAIIQTSRHLTPVFLRGVYATTMDFPFGERIARREKFMSKIFPFLNQYYPWLSENQVFDTLIKHRMPLPKMQ